MFQYTGNPFVDAGIYAICEWIGKSKPQELNKNDLKILINDIVPLYLTSGWSKSQYSIFPNNPITNPSVKDKEGYLRKYLLGLLKEIEPLKESGTCITCGKRDVTNIRTKTEIPMIGSGGLINYFPNGQSGGDYCPACTFAVQFSPLVMYSCVKLLLFHSNSEKVLKYWTKKAIGEVKKQLVTKNFTGCFNEGYTNPTNALFHLIQDIVLKYEERWLDENPSINLYHFTNYIQGPDLEIYTLPTPVFRFLVYAKMHEKHSDWMKVIKKGYSVNWDNVMEEKEYKNKTNKVYLNLLNGISITRYFLDFKNKAVLGDWDLLSYYLKEVRKMDNKRIETLKRVGDEISDYIKETTKIRRLNQLEIAKNYQSFRNILRIIEKDRIKIGSRGPLFTLDELVDDLFPEAHIGWKETQDLLLFRIYENLHDWLIEQKQLAEELTIEEVEMEG